MAEIEIIPTINKTVTWSQIKGIFWSKNSLLKSIQEREFLKLQYQDYSLNDLEIIGNHKNYTINSDYGFIFLHFSQVDFSLDDAFDVLKGYKCENKSLLDHLSKSWLTLGYSINIEANPKDTEEAKALFLFVMIFTELYKGYILVDHH